MQRYFSMPPAVATPPSVLVRSLKTLSASKTRLTDTMRCGATPTGARTLQSATEHSLTTPVAASTLHWALEGGQTLQQAITTSTLETLASQASLIPSGLAET